MGYKLELDKAVKEIKDNEAKLVLIQLPDGLKPNSKDISDKIKEQTGARVLIWAGSCFGACDIPYDVEKLGVDLIITWGHSPWKKPEIK